MAKESQLWTWLSGARKVMRENVDLRRVEDSMGAGFPDVDGFAVIDGEKFGFKLELKSEVRPARATTKIPFKVKGREAQCEFMRRRWVMGENAHYFLQVGQASNAVRYLAPGDIGQLLHDGVTEAALAVHVATNGGLVFDHKTKPAEVIEWIHKCAARRFFS